MLEFAKSIAKFAGKISLAEFPQINQNEIAFKMKKDLVTDVDKKVEEYLIGEISREFPEHCIFGEDFGRNDKKSEFCWIIDPIDGTTSYVHNQPYYSVSIGLYKNDQPFLGVVYAPRLNELYWAENGKGSYLNGGKIHVSSTENLINAVLSTGFACLRADLKDNNLPYFNEIAPTIRGIRRYGSAAIDLGYVASGRIDGFWEINLQLYDIAAGLVLVKEAGGNICDFKGGGNYPGQGLIATNGKIDPEFLPFFK